MPEHAPLSLGPPGNRWDLLAVHRLGEWDPALTVSVLIPARTDQLTLERTLAGIAEQSYPSTLAQVIVVDDGSTPPLIAPPWFDYCGFELIRQEHAGDFGAGRARGVAAERAEGDVVLFVDADMVPEHQAVEAHMRWHDADPDAVTLGFARFVDFDGVTPEAIRSRSRSGLSALFEGRRYEEQKWREKTFVATDDLRRERADLFRVVVSASLGVRRSLFDEVGGFRPQGLRGIEDTEFGYRLFTAGGLLVPDREAFHWHQGMRFFDSDKAAEAKRRRTPALENFIPMPGFRPPTRGRIYEVPRIHVVLEAGGGLYEEVSASVASMLRGDMSDIEIDVIMPPHGADSVLIEHAYSKDPRIRVRSPRSTPTFDDAPVTVLISSPVGLPPAALRATYRALIDAPVGSARMTIGGSEIGWAVRTRALQRLRRRGASDLRTAVAELFGAIELPLDDLRPAPRGDKAPTDTDATGLWRRLKTRARWALTQARG